MAIAQEYFSNGMPAQRVNWLKLLLIIILVAIMGLELSALFIHIIRLHFTLPKNPWIGYLSIFFIVLVFNLSFITFQHPVVLPRVLRVPRTQGQRPVVRKGLYNSLYTYTQGN
jgi:hypothetical protein